MAAALCMNATTDIDLQDQVYWHYLPQAVEEGLVAVDTIKRAVWRSLNLRMRLGDFDPADMVPYQQIRPDHLNTPENQAANLDTVHKSMTLLKNINNTLPLNAKNISNIVIIGPNGNNAIGQMSNYYGNSEFIVTISQSIEAFVAGSGVNVTLSPGCANTSCIVSTYIEEAVIAANNADVVILAVGLDKLIEAEAKDRILFPCDGVYGNVYELPGCQNLLVSSIVNSTAKTIVMLLMHGGGVAIDFALSSPRISAILDVYYPSKGARA